MKTLISISLTNACPNRCSYCIAKGTQKSIPLDPYGNIECRGVYIDISQLLHFLRTAREQIDGGIVIALTGGEPLAHPAFVPIVNGIRSLLWENDKIALYSNLKLLNMHSINAIISHIDFAIAGYHPENFMPDGTHCGSNWLAGQIRKLTPVRAVVNYVKGAYSNPNKWFNHEEDIDVTLGEFFKYGINAIVTPLNHNTAIEGTNRQMSKAPRMLNVRCDGSIIGCSGFPDVSGSIYTHDFSINMLDNKHCILCPEYNLFLRNEDLFMEKENG
jgi:hypothetical protein